MSVLGIRCPESDTFPGVCHWETPDRGILQLEPQADRLIGSDIFLESRRFAVNILTKEQQDISNHFASRGTDRSQVPYVPGRTGIPVVTGSMA